MTLDKYMPIGYIHWWKKDDLDSLPDNWRVCDGSPITGITEEDLQVPDLRNEPVKMPSYTPAAMNGLNIILDGYIYIIKVKK